MGKDIIKTTCLGCLAGCGMLVELKDGVPVKIKGDPDSQAGKGVLCEKGKASLKLLNHKDRLKKPLKRCGNRGSGKWEEISWEEALKIVASSLNSIKDESGPETVAFIEGGSKCYLDSYFHRFANVFGSPNYTKAAPVCFMPTFLGSIFTYGNLRRVDYEGNPECIIVWGCNHLSNSLPEAAKLITAIKNGTKIIVVDPFEISLAKKADIWARIRPGTDVVLALGLINVIISEKLYDKKFVDEWTVGFEKLKSHILQYTPSHVAEITWIAEETIISIARMYAKRSPSCIIVGNGVENTLNNFQFSRAASILRALTGNIGISGGEITWERKETKNIHAHDMVLWDLISEKVRDEKWISKDEGLIPMTFFTLHQNLTNAMKNKGPNRVRGAMVVGANPLMMWPNSKDVKKAFESLDFLVVSDYFMTSTAAMADIVLPASTYMEIDGIHISEYVPEINIVQKVGQIGECWSDLKIFIELSKAMGLTDYGWDQEKDALDFILSPLGIDYETFRSICRMPAKKLINEHRINGFHTPSTKIELYSKQLERMGFDPLPTYRDYFDSIEEDEKADYPFMLTNMKVSQYKHSTYRQIESLRAQHPEPIVFINSQTAKKLDIKEDEKVTIRTKYGSVWHKATLSDSLHPQVIMGEHGWWFPERKNILKGSFEANLNVLTSNNRPFSKEMGSYTLRGIPCTIEKRNSS